MAWITNASNAQAEVVSDTCSFQTLSREWGSVYKLRVRTRATEYRGLDVSLAKNFGTDASYITQTAGTYYFEHYTRKVERHKANAAGGWTVTVNEAWSGLYMNNSYMAVNTLPESVFTAADPQAPSS